MIGWHKDVSCTDIAFCPATEIQHGNRSVVVKFKIDVYNAPVSAEI